MHIMLDVSQTVMITAYPSQPVHIISSFNAQIKLI